MNLTTVRLLGSVLEDTWGKSSSPDGTYSITYDLNEGALTLKFTTVVHFADDAGLRPQIEAAYNQALQLIDAKMGLVKDAFKKVADVSFKTEDLGGKDDLELIQPQGPRKIAYYRYNHVFKIED